MNIATYDPSLPNTVEGIAERLSSQHRNNAANYGARMRGFRPPLMSSASYTRMACPQLPRDMSDEFWARFGIGS